MALENDEETQRLNEELHGRLHNEAVKRQQDQQRQDFTLKNGSQQDIQAMVRQMVQAELKKIKITGPAVQGSNGHWVID